MENFDFPPFAVCVDLVILTVRAEKLQVLLVERAEDPFEGKLALPGGFVGIDQELMNAASSKLADKTGLTMDHYHLEQLGTYGSPNRDPRMRVVSVAYLAFTANLKEVHAGTNTREAFFADAHSVDTDQLAFDHGKILADGIARAQAKLEYTTLSTEFCDEKFTLSNLREIYQAVWNYKIDLRNFNRKVIASAGFVEESGDSVTAARGRPARLYTAGNAKDIHPPLRMSVELSS